MPAVQLLIKPASGNCNLRCSYCFYADVTAHREIQSYGIMQPETLKVLIRETFAYAENRVSIAFQGGEPMLAGLDFFREYIRLVEQYNVNKLPVEHAIQTNGTLITDEWAKFFTDQGFLVGLSLDGTRKNHDRYRLSTQGEGTFSDVWAKVQLLKDHEVEFNILTVVTRETAENVRKIYEFYKSRNLPWQQYIPCLNPLGEEDVIYDHTLTSDMYGEFLCELFDLWYEDFRQGTFVTNRYFENLVSMLLGQAPEMCGMLGVCAPQLVVEADGSFYPCDFYVLDEYHLGNIHELTLAEIDQNRRNSSFQSESIPVCEQCTACEWLPICRGGCRRHREPLSEAGALNIYCSAYQKFFSHAIGRLQQVAAYVERRNRV